MSTIDAKETTPALWTSASSRPNRSERPCDERLAGVSVADVLDARQGAPSPVADLPRDGRGDGGVAPFAVPFDAGVVDDDVRTPLGEGQRVRTSQPPAGARHEHDLPVEADGVSG